MIEHTIYCDFCGEMIDIQTGSTRQVRRKAKAKGLLIRILRKDYCQNCAEKLHNEGEIDKSDLPEKFPSKSKTGRFTSKSFPLSGNKKEARLKPRGCGLTSLMSLSFVLFIL